MGRVLSHLAHALGADGGGGLGFSSLTLLLSEPRCGPTSEGGPAARLGGRRRRRREEEALRQRQRPGPPSLLIRIAN